MVNSLEALIIQGSAERMLNIPNNLTSEIYSDLKQLEEHLKGQALHNVPNALMRMSALISLHTLDTSKINPSLLVAHGYDIVEYPEQHIVNVFDILGQLQYKQIVSVEVIDNSYIENVRTYFNFTMPQRLYNILQIQSIDNKIKGTNVLLVRRLVNEINDIVGHLSRTHLENNNLITAKRTLAGQLFIHAHNIMSFLLDYSEVNMSSRYEELYALLKEYISNEIYDFVYFIEALENLEATYA